jgi:P4 family phage/plasmid primase-like protien
MAKQVKPRGGNPLLQVTGAGKERFDEHRTYQTLMRKIPPVIVFDEDWFEYDGRAWRPSRRKKYLSKVYDILPVEHRSARLASNVLNAVEAARQIENEKLRGALAFDDDGRVLVNVNNGVLRVAAEQVELLAHAPEYFFTGCLAANYHDDSQSALFEASLDAILHDVKDKALLQWFAGYCLFPDCKQHEVFLICYGPGGTGKSTLAEAIVSAFDDDVLVRRLSLSQICSSGPGSYSLPTLERAMVNLGTELDTVEVDESGTFKQLISGESIVARSIYGKPFTMTSTCKHLFLSNVMPRFKHGTDAELRRARFLAFGKKPQAIDRTLKDKLKLVAQKDYILRWAIEGLRAILEGMPAPYGGEESNDAIRRFQISNDPVQCFIREVLQFDPNHEETKENVMTAFTEFLDAHQFAHRTREYFFRAFYERNPQIRVVRYQNKSPQYWLRGVRLTR